LLIGLLHTGARYREIARMSWSQIDLDGRKVRIHRQKGGADSTLVMSEQLHGMLVRRNSKATDQWVFPTKRRHNNNYATVSLDRLADFREFAEWASVCLPPEGPNTWRAVARKQIARYRSCKPRVIGHTITVAAYADDIGLKIRLAWC
jgi:integrase